MAEITIEEQDFYKGIKYYIKAISAGYRCGYVEVPKELQNLKFNDYNSETEINCHGGINYHKDNIIGFDCLHSGDGVDEAIMQGSRISDSFKACFNGRVWFKEDVRDECHHIIDQLIELKNKKRGGA